MTPQRERPTNLLGDGVPPEGPANPGVPRGYICEKCPELIDAIARIETRQEETLRQSKAVQEAQEKIFGLLRDTNGKVADEKLDMAVLQTKVRIYVAFVALVATPIWAGVAAFLIQRLYGH